MRINTLGFLFLTIVFISHAYGQEAKHEGSEPETDNMLVRIAEIEIDSNYVKEYLIILKEEAEASVRLEPGVICIYPMFVKENPTKIRLLEIYADRNSYESHLQTPHFKHYKEATLKMVKHLKLIDMEAINTEAMPMIFRKLNK